MEVDRLNRKAPRVVRPCSPAQRGTLRDGLCRAHERDRYGVEHPSQERVRKAVCHESGLHGLEQGKGVSPTYCYNFAPCGSNVGFYPAVQTEKTLLFPYIRVKIQDF